MGPELVGILAAAAGVIGLLWSYSRKSAQAPLDEVAPPLKIPRPKQESFSRGDRLLDAVAARHGLRRDIDSVRGRVDGLRVEISAFPHGAAEETVLQIHGRARFDGPLDLELRVNPRSGAGVDESRFTELFRVHALHDDQAEALFRPELAARFAAGQRAGLAPVLTDEELTISVSGRQSEQSVVNASVWMVETALEVERARARLPRPQLEQRVESAFRSLADAHAGELDLARGTFRAPLEQGELRGSVTVHGRDAKAILELSFRHPLPVELRLGLEPSRGFVGRFRHTDIQLGDPPFDDAFLVKGDPESEVQALLAEPVRAALLGLRELVRDLTVESDSLRVTLDVSGTDADQLRDVVERMRRVANALLPESERSAYR